VCRWQTVCITYTQENMHAHASYVHALYVDMHLVWHWYRLARWLEIALLVLSPEHAPWFKLKLESKSAFMQELLSQEMEGDLTRFKRHVKVGLYTHACVCTSVACMSVCVCM